MSELNMQSVDQGDLTDADVLKQTQQRKFKLLQTLEKTEAGVPTDAKEMQVYLQTLESLDRVAISKMKIQSAEGMAEGDRLAALTIAKLTQQMQGVNPFMTDANAPLKAGIPEVDASLLPEVDLVPGETDIGVSTQTYEQFVNEVEATLERA